MGTQRDEMIFIMTPRDLKQESCWANLRTHGVNSLFKLYLETSSIIYQRNSQLGNTMFELETKINLETRCCF